MSGADKYHYAGTRAILFDEKSRFEKAEKIYLAIKENYSGDLAEAIALDIGCSSGLIGLWLAGKVREIYGIDIDDDITGYVRKIEERAHNFHFMQAGGDRLPFEDGKFDVIISNIMYNLMPTDMQEKMMSEIHRCLKPTGVCYFAGPNKLCPVNGKYRLPFIDALPLSLARIYAKALSPIKETYNEFPKNVFGMQRMFAPLFEYKDITLKIIDDPDRYNFPLPQNGIARVAASLAARIFYVFMPNYIFILRKKPE